MNYFEIQNDNLIFRAGGETLMISPWGNNSLRIRSRILGDFSDDNAGLLPPPPTNPQISVTETEATFTNGNICAVLKAPSGCISFFNQDRTLLLKESRRHFKPLPGGSSKLKMSFIPPSGEKLYGMGQYQQDILDLKGCSLDLWHHNT